jgi:hypothetical protein
MSKNSTIVLMYHCHKTLFCLFYDHAVQLSKELPEPCLLGATFVTTSEIRKTAILISLKAES